MGNSKIKQINRQHFLSQKLKYANDRKPEDDPGRFAKKIYAKLKILSV